MHATAYLLPKPVGQLLSRLPAYPGSLLFVTGLNLALASKLAPDVTQLLLGKKLRLRVTDAQLELGLSMPLFGGPAIPLSRRRVVLGHALSAVVRLSQVELCPWVSSLRPLEARGIGAVFLTPACGDS